MQRARETGKTPQVRGAAGAARRAFVCGFVALLALPGGCNLMQRPKAPAEGEPLFGEFHKQTYAPAPPPGKTTSSKSADPGAPPSFSPATSTASIGAIAGGDPMMGSHPLGIPNAVAGQNQQAGAWQGTKLTANQPNANLSPGLRAPVVEALPAAPNAVGLPAAGAVAPPPWTNPAAQASYEQLQQQLRARGMTWYRQETWQGGVKFSCSVPNPINPTFDRTYEATARDYQSALQAVLDQIDRDRPQR